MNNDFGGFVFGRPAKPKRRIYDHCEPWIGAENPTIIKVDLSLLNAALRGDSNWAYCHTDRDQETFVLPKYEDARRAIESGATITTPRLYFKHGRTRVMDGRHRLYSMIDLGYTHAQITVAGEDLHALSSLIDEND